MKQLDLDEDSLVDVRLLCVKYQAQGYTVLLMSYSGSGDEGCLDKASMIQANLELDPANWGLDVEELPLEAAELDLAENLYYEAVLAAGHEGYENNDGGQGAVYLVLSTGQLHVAHQDNFISYDETDTDLSILL